MSQLDKLYKEALQNISWTDPNGEEIKSQFPELAEQKPHQCGTSYCRQRFDSAEALAEHADGHKKMKY